MLKKFFLICTLIISNLNTVFANEINPLESKEVLIQTYNFAGDVLNYKELIPNEINHKGNIYKMIDIKAEENTKIETINKTENVEKIVTDTKKENVITLFEKELNINNDNLKGTLKLDENSLEITKNQVENVTNYKTQKYSLFENKSYYGLESNDYSLLPQTLNKNGKTLKLISAEFIKTNSNDIYNANCKYGATFTKKIPNTKEVVKDYKATVNYVGELEKTTVESRDVTVFYSQDKSIENNEIINNTEEISNKTNTESNTQIENSLLNKLFILCVLILISLSIVIIFVVKSKNKNERRKNFEKTNYKSKKHKYKNKKNEK